MRDGAAGGAGAIDAGAADSRSAGGNDGGLDAPDAPGDGGAAGAGGGIIDAGGTGGIGDASTTTDGNGGAAGIDAADGPAGPCSTICTNVVSLAGAHLTADAARGRIYVSVGGGAASLPNRIVVLDARDGSILGSTAAGSDPNLIALSDDGSTLWAGIDGTGAVRKFAVDVVPPVAGPLTSLSPFVAAGHPAPNLSQLTVLPGQPTAIAAIVGASFSGATISVFNDGALGVHAAATNVGPGLVAGPSGLLFGTGTTGSSAALNVFTIGATAISEATSTGLLSSTGRLVYAGGHLYSSEGEAIDVSNPAAPTRIGEFAFRGPLTVRSSNRLLQLAAPLPVPGGDLPGQLRLLDTDTFTSMASVSVPLDVIGSDDTVIDVAYAGGDAVAVLISGISIASRPRIVILHAPLVGAPLPGGGNVDAGTDAGDAGQPDGGVNPCPGCTFTKITAAEAWHMVYDATRSRLYATLDSEASQNPNTLAIVDTATNTVTANLPTGKNPRPLALSDDASTLWVGATDDHAIQKIDLTTTPPTVAAEQVLTAVAADLAVLPGTRTSVAVGALTGSQKVMIFDDGVMRPSVVSSNLVTVSQLIFGAPGYIYGYDSASSGFELSVITFDATGVTLSSETSGFVGGFHNAIRLVGQRIYSFDGEVLDVSAPATPARAGRFDYMGIVAARDANHILMVTGIAAGLGASKLLVLEPTNFTPLASVSLPSSVFPAAPQMNDLVYLGGDRLALAMNDFSNHQVVVVIEAPVILTP